MTIGRRTSAAALVSASMLALASCSAAATSQYPKAVEVTTDFGEIVTCIQAGAAIDCDWDNTRLAAP